MIDSVACDDRTVDMFDLLQALDMDFITAYLFGSENGTRFLEGRISPPLVCQILRSSTVRGLKSGEIEQWCMAMGKAAEGLMRSEKSGTGTRAVVYSRLFQCLEADGAET